MKSPEAARLFFNTDASRHDRRSVPGRHIGVDPSDTLRRTWPEPATLPRPSLPERPAVTPVREVLANERPRVVMIAGDAIALALSAFIVQLLVGAIGLRGLLDVIATTAVATAIGMWAVRAQGLWMLRISEMRTIEIAKLTRGAGLLAVVLFSAARVLGFGHRNTTIALIGLTAWLALVMWRSIVRVWLTSSRRAGRYVRRTLIIGANREAEELFEATHSVPEHGMRVVGVVGVATPRAVRTFGDLLVAGGDDMSTVLTRFDPDCVVVCNPLLDATVLNEIIEHQHERDREVMLDPGIGRINFRSVQFSQVAYEPFLYVEKTNLSRPQMMVKRAFDVAVAALMLIVLSVPMLLIAAAVKLTDGGPVLFSQTRVGRTGTTFPVLKFRTMVVDAEARLAELQRRNERNGPLFKMDDDPRVTRVGRFLRDSSLDELPQLFNVLRGQMSLVGPRPALPSEVLEFTSQLRRREIVTPGITGLWQVEARDSASFASYERLDLYYVEHWSLSLDLVILVGTAEQVLVRLVTSRVRSARSRRAAAVARRHDAGVSGVAGVTGVAGPAPFPTDAPASEPIAHGVAMGRAVTKL